MNVKFKRPVVFFDLETTGTNTEKDRIVELCIVIIYHDRLHSRTITQRVNPTIPIPKQASDIHGITDEMVKDCPTFKDIAPEIFEAIKGFDIVGYNSINFDIPMLYAELSRAGIVWDYTGVNFIDVCNIFKIKEARTLTAAVKFYLDEDHEDAHGAEADVAATIRVFERQVMKYGLHEQTPEQLALMSNYDRPMLDLSGRFTLNANGDIVFTFGKHKDMLAKDNRSYLDWMLKGEFSEDTKRICRLILYPPPPQTKMNL